MTDTPSPAEVVERLEAFAAHLVRGVTVSGDVMETGPDDAAIELSASDLRAAAALIRELTEALKPFAESLVAQTNVEHHSQDWREETDDTVVSITTSHQRKGMPYLAPDHTLWIGAFRRAAKLVAPASPTQENGNG